MRRQAQRQRALLGGRCGPWGARIHRRPSRESLRGDAYVACVRGVEDDEDVQRLKRFRPRSTHWSGGVTTSMAVITAEPLSAAGAPRRSSHEHWVSPAVRAPLVGCVRRVPRVSRCRHRYSRKAAEIWSVPKSSTAYGRTAPALLQGAAAGPHGAGRRCSARRIAVAMAAGGLPPSPPLPVAVLGVRVSLNRLRPLARHVKPSLLCRLQRLRPLASSSSPSSSWRCVRLVLVLVLFLLLRPPASSSCLLRPRPGSSSCTLPNVRLVLRPASSPASCVPVLVLFFLLVLRPRPRPLLPPRPPPAPSSCVLFLRPPAPASSASASPLTRSPGDSSDQSIGPHQRRSGDAVGCTHTCTRA